MRALTVALTLFALALCCLPAAAQFPAPDTYNSPWYAWCGPGPANRTVNVCTPPDGVSFNPTTQIVRLRIGDTHWPITYTETVNGREIYPEPQTPGSLDIASGLVPLDPTVSGTQQVTFTFKDAVGTFQKTFFATYEETPCSVPTTNQTINFCTLTEGESVTSPVAN